MKATQRFRLVATLGFLTLAGLQSRADFNFTDNFTTSYNFVTNGVVGSAWDGIYLGGTDFANPGGIGLGLGSVSVANANISSNGVLTVTSVHTDWENAADDGFFLYKV